MASHKSSEYDDVPCQTLVTASRAGETTALAGLAVVATLKADLEEGEA
jgi:hypothetical protein